jgi:hypothetical protein
MRKLLLVLFTFILVTCKSTQTSLDYGVLDKRLVCSNIGYKNDQITFKVGGYIFIFNDKEFEDELISFDSDSFTNIFEKFNSDYIKNGKLEIEKSKGGYIINNSYKLNINEYFAIITSLDNLYKSNRFYLKSGKNIKCMEYKHWSPHEHGSIYYNWIIKGKVINQNTFGFSY